MFRNSVNICSILIISIALQCESLTQLTATTTPGYFFSPIFPEHNIQQSWRLKAADPRHLVHLEIVDSEIDPRTACLYDYLQVHDGPGTSDPVIGKVCTKDAPTYVTTAGSMFVLFTLDNSGRYLGFYIKFYSSGPAVPSQPTVEIPASAAIRSTTSAFPVTESNPTGQSKAAASTLTATSLIGILIAVAFCLTVVVVIIASICIHNSNKIDVQPKRSPDEEEIWQRVSSLPKPRKPKPGSIEPDHSNTSTTSTFYLNTSSTSGFSSGAPCSPSSLYPVIAEGHPEDHQYHTLSPVPEVIRSINIEDDHKRHQGSSPKQYAHADMMELSPRRLLPIRVAPVKAPIVTLPKGGPLPDSASFYDEINGQDVTSTPRSQVSNQELPNSLQRAREARRVRFKENKKNGEDFERGHTHMKNSLINRIDLVRCGVLTGQRSSVPRVKEGNMYRERVTPDS